jgi:hypothetical protein
MDSSAASIEELLSMPGRENKSRRAMACYGKNPLKKKKLIINACGTRFSKNRKM